MSPNFAVLTFMGSYEIFLLLCVYIHISSVCVSQSVVGGMIGEVGALNVYTGQNPRRHVVFIEIQPNKYNKYLP
jgi:hypothetical protein